MTVLSDHHAPASKVCQVNRTPHWVHTRPCWCCIVEHRFTYNFLKHFADRLSLTQQSPWPSSDKENSPLYLDQCVCLVPVCITDIIWWGKVSQHCDLRFGTWIHFKTSQQKATVLYFTSWWSFKKLPKKACSSWEYSLSGQWQIGEWELF